MSAPATDLDAPPVRVPRREFRTALVWALVSGAYAGALWAACWSVAFRGAFPFGRADVAAWATFITAMVGGMLGLGAGTAVGISRLFRDRFRWELPVLMLGGTVFGSIGCGLSAYVAVAASDHLHPLLSSSLAMAVSGFFAGLCGQDVSRRLALAERAKRPRRLVPTVLEAIGWALAAAVCAGSAWAVACVAMRAILGVSMPFDRADSETATQVLMFAALGAVYGGLVGAFVGCCRESGERGRTALVLGIGGALFGAHSGALSALVASADGVLPLLGSSLTMAVVGFCAGLCWYLVSPKPAKPEPLPYDDEPEESDSPSAKVEWVLREPKRRWHISRPLARVLPILAVALGAGVGAVFTSSPEALIAVALLGLAVAWALYRQEQRLDALERRCRERS